MTISPPPAPHVFTPTRDRLDWVITLHWRVANVLLALLIGIWLVLPIPGGLLASLTMWATVVAFAEITRRRLRRLDGDEAMIERGALRLMVGMAVLDTLVMTGGVAVSGGPSSLGLPLLGIPLMVYGLFVPWPLAVGQLVFAAAALGVLFLAELAGRVPQACVPDLGCALPAPHVVLAIWLSTVVRGCVMTALATHVGGLLRRGEQAARTLAAEQDALATARSQGLEELGVAMAPGLATVRHAVGVLTAARDGAGGPPPAATVESILDAVRTMTAAIERVLHKAPSPPDRPLFG